MSITYKTSATPNGPRCYQIDEFDNHKEYEFDCSLMSNPPDRTATLPTKEWFDEALYKYFYWKTEEDAITAANLLNIDLEDYYVLNPLVEPNSESMGLQVEVYVATNQPIFVQNFVNFIRTIPIGM